MLDSNWTFASVAQLCGHLRVAHHKVLFWINSGQLRANNIATTTTTRPVYRIDRAAFDQFWASRATAPPVAAPRRSARSKTAVKSFV
jgi:hypothetical protein